MGGNRDREGAFAVLRNYETPSILLPPTPKLLILRTLHDTILAYLIESVASAGIPHKGGFGNTCKNVFAHCIHNNLVSDDDERHLQGIIPDMMLDCSLPPGQPSNPLDGCRQLVELKTISQRNVPVEERAVKIQRDVVQHATELDARDPRNRVHAELMSYGIGGQYVALVVGRFGEFSKDFIKLRDYIARQKAYAYVVRRALQLLSHQRDVDFQAQHHIALSAGR